MTCCSMPSEKLEIVLGSEFRTSFTWLDSDGNAQDATGATVAASLRHPWTHAPYAATVITGWTDAANGVGEINIDETQTALVERGALSELVITVVDTGTVTDIFVGGIVEGV